MSLGSSSNVVFDGLRHPLLLLVVGSVIGSFLIPSISERVSRKRVLQEARLRKAVEIVENNTKTVSQINALVTRLGMFHSDNIRLKPSPAKLRESQEKLAEDMNNRYLEFDRTAWWWYRDLIDEAVILEIVPPTGSEKLREHVNAYGNNIHQTVDVLNELWQPCLDADYDYKNDKVTQIKNTMDKRLQDLFNARNDKVNHLVNDFLETH